MSKSKIFKNPFKKIIIFSIIIISLTTFLTITPINAEEETSSSYLNENITDEYPELKGKDKKELIEVFFDDEELVEKLLKQQTLDNFDYTLQKYMINTDEISTRRIKDFLDLKWISERDEEDLTTTAIYNLKNLGMWDDTFEYLMISYSPTIIWEEKIQQIQTNNDNIYLPIKNSEKTEDLKHEYLPLENNLIEIYKTPIYLKGGVKGGWPDKYKSIINHKIKDKEDYDNENIINFFKNKYSNKSKNIIDYSELEKSNGRHFKPLFKDKSKYVNVFKNIIKIGKNIEDIHDYSNSEKDRIKTKIDRREDFLEEYGFKDDSDYNEWIEESETPNMLISKAKQKYKDTDDSKYDKIMHNLDLSSTLLKDLEFNNEESWNLLSDNENSDEELIKSNKIYENPDMSPSNAFLYTYLNLVDNHFRRPEEGFKWDKESEEGYNNENSFYYAEKLSDWAMEIVEKSIKEMDNNIDEDLERMGNIKDNLEDENLNNIDSKLVNNINTEMQDLNEELEDINPDQDIGVGQDSSNPIIEIEGEKYSVKGFIDDFDTIKSSIEKDKDNYFEDFLKIIKSEKLPKEQEGISTIFSSNNEEDSPVSYTKYNDMEKNLNKRVDKIDSLKNNLQDYTTVNKDFLTKVNTNTIEMFEELNSEEVRSSSEEGIIGDALISYKSFEKEIEKLKDNLEKNNYHNSLNNIDKSIEEFNNFYDTHQSVTNPEDKLSETNQNIEDIETKIDGLEDNLEKYKDGVKGEINCNDEEIITEVEEYISESKQKLDNSREELEDVDESKLEESDSGENTTNFVYLKNAQEFLNISEDEIDDGIDKFDGDLLEDIILEKLKGKYENLEDDKELINNLIDITDDLSKYESLEKFEKDIESLDSDYNKYYVSEYDSTTFKVSEMFKDEEIINFVNDIKEVRSDFEDWGVNNIDYLENEFINVDSEIMNTDSNIVIGDYSTVELKVSAESDFDYSRFVDNPKQYDGVITIPDDYENLEIEKVLEEDGNVYTEKVDDYTVNDNSTLKKNINIPSIPISNESNNSIIVRLDTVIVKELDEEYTQEDALSEDKKKINLTKNIDIVYPLNNVDLSFNIDSSTLIDPTINNYDNIVINNKNENDKQSEVQIPNVDLDNTDYTSINDYDNINVEWREEYPKFVSDNDYTDLEIEKLETGENKVIETRVLKNQSDLDLENISKKVNLYGIPENRNNVNIEIVEGENNIENIKLDNTKLELNISEMKSERKQVYKITYIVENLEEMTDYLLSQVNELETEINDHIDNINDIDLSEFEERLNNTIQEKDNAVEYKEEKEYENAIDILHDIKTILEEDKNKLETISQNIEDYQNSLTDLEERIETAKSLKESISEFVKSSSKNDLELKISDAEDAVSNAEENLPNITQSINILGDAKEGLNNTIDDISSEITNTIGEYQTQFKSTLDNLKERKNNLLNFDVVIDSEYDINDLSYEVTTLDSPKYDETERIEKLSELSSKINNLESTIQSKEKEFITNRMDIIEEEVNNNLENINNTVEKVNQVKKEFEFNVTEDNLLYEDYTVEELKETVKNDLLSNVDKDSLNDVEDILIGLKEEVSEDEDKIDTISQYINQEKYHKAINEYGDITSVNLTSQEEEIQNIQNKLQEITDTEIDDLYTAINTIDNENINNEKYQEVEERHNTLSNDTENYNTITKLALIEDTRKETNKLVEEIGSYESDEGDEPVTPPEKDGGENNLLFIGIGMIIVLLVIFIILRKKKPGLIMGGNNTTTESSTDEMFEETTEEKDLGFEEETNEKEEDEETLGFGNSETIEEENNNENKEVGSENETIEKQDRIENNEEEYLGLENSETIEEKNNSKDFEEEIKDIEELEEKETKKSDNQENQEKIEEEEDDLSELDDIDDI